MVENTSGETSSLIEGHQKTEAVVRKTFLEMISLFKLKTKPVHINNLYIINVYPLF